MKMIFKIDDLVIGHYCMPENEVETRVFGNGADHRGLNKGFGGENIIARC